MLWEKRCIMMQCGVIYAEAFCANCVVNGSSQSYHQDIDTGGEAAQHVVSSAQ